LLVPKAVKGGNPINTSAGNTINPPTPANVSTMPAVIATKNRENECF
tara:strand:+ start:1840 stop:1980 length:141 start_codon:yes stop_codon:yes gene_type:complete